jgi:two-component system, OmpR family, phosphate regulon sensor histidine kinase PhoR
VRGGIRARLFVLTWSVTALLVTVVPAYVGSIPGRLVLATFAAALIARAGASRTWRTAQLLAAAARRMAKGDFSSRTRTLGDVEFHELGQSLDQLAHSLSTTLGELKIERDLLGGILTGMQEGVLLLDKGGRVALVNPALRDMLLLGGDPIGKYPLEAIHNSELTGLLDRASVAHLPTTGEVEVLGIKPRRLLARASALTVDPGGLLAVFVDVTDIRRLEAVRRDFVANVSHELRTPVTAIRSAAETIRGAAARDPVAAVRFLDIIERNAERLQQLVEDLLDLSRIESREFRLTHELLELQIFVPYVLSLFRERAEKKRIRLHARLPQDLPPIATDRRVLEQVISNLIDNAVKYCPTGAEVAVRARVEGNSLRVFVEDTGLGIDAKHLPRLFERFYRVDAGRSRAVGGTGLGLSIVKHLVEALGSNVSVESVLGKGSAFSFALPLAREPLASSASSSRVASAQRASSAELSEPSTD